MELPEKWGRDRGVPRFGSQGKKELQGGEGEWPLCLCYSGAKKCVD